MDSHLGQIFTVTPHCMHVNATGPYHCKAMIRPAMDHIGIGKTQTKDTMHNGSSRRRLSMGGPTGQ